MNFIKKRIHDYLIKQLKNVVNEERIDLKNKKVDLGLEHIGTAFMSDKDKFVCYLLVKYYGYQFYVKSLSHTIRSMMVEAMQKHYAEYEKQKISDAAPPIPQSISLE